MDLVALPRARHEWTGYGHRRRLDYFVRHRLGETPPAPAPFRDLMTELMAMLAANAQPPTALAEEAHGAA